MNEQPNEIQDVAEEIGGTLAAAFEVLIQRRDTAYAAAIEPLDAEDQSLREEYVSLGDAARNLEKLLPATAREAQRAADALLLAGKADKAEVKLQEAQQADSAPEAMKERQREITARIEAIEAEKQAAARRIFSTCYAEAQSVVRAAERGLFCTLLDGLKASFYQFQERTGTGGTFDHPYSFLVKDSHLQNLTAPERSEEWTAGSRWYSAGGSR
jgi:nucleoid-associated protein YgaU